MNNEIKCWACDLCGWAWCDNSENRCAHKSHWVLRSIDGKKVRDESKKSKETSKNSSRGNGGTVK